MRLVITHRYRVSGALVCRLTWPERYVYDSLLGEVWDSAIDFDARGVSTTVEWLEAVECAA